MPASKGSSRTTPVPRVFWTSQPGASLMARRDALRQPTRWSPAQGSGLRDDPDTASCAA